MTTSHNTRIAGVTITAVEHVAAVTGSIMLFRGLVDDMHRAAERRVTDADAIGSEIAGWVERFDFIGNTLSASNDALIDALQAARIPSVLSTGSLVLRNRLGGRHAESAA